MCDTLHAFTEMWEFVYFSPSALFTRDDRETPAMIDPFALQQSIFGQLLLATEWVSQAFSTPIKIIKLTSRKNSLYKYIGLPLKCPLSILKSGVVCVWVEFEIGHLDFRQILRASYSTRVNNSMVRCKLLLVLPFTDFGLSYFQLRENIPWKRLLFLVSFYCSRSNFCRTYYKVDARRNRVSQPLRVKHI